MTAATPLSGDFYFGHDDSYPRWYPSLSKWCSEIDRLSNSVVTLASIADVKDETLPTDLSKGSDDDRLLLTTIFEVLRLDLKLGSQPSSTSAASQGRRQARVLIIISNTKPKSRTPSPGGAFLITVLR